MNPSNVQLVEAIRDGLPPSLEWTERDRMLIELARGQARDLDAVEAALPSAGDLGLLREARNQRIALGRLIGLVDVPHEQSTASQHAARAARVRWKAS